MHINLDSLKSPLISTLISGHTVIFSSHILALYLTDRPPQEWRTYCRTDSSLLAYRHHCLLTNEFSRKWCHLS